MEDTISAIATALGVGAVGIIRVSGPESLRLVNRIFRAKEPLSSSRPRYLQYGHIHDGKGVDVDEVLAVYMPGPHSYTGEDVVEIQCHGGREALKEILRLTFSEGARPAEPGEFTKRAFLNGRLDLTEAEAFMDIINAKSRRALVAAGRGHKGALSRSIREIRGRLRDLVVHLEAIIDYPEDDIEDVTYDETEGVLQQCYDAVMQLRKKGETGQILREGLRIAIVGRPNVGKSTFINKVARRKAAAAGDRPGVTRGKQWITVDQGLELLDTPGILWPKFEDQQVGLKLAFTGAINDDILDPENMAIAFINHMISRNPDCLRNRYQITFDTIEEPHVILEKIAMARGFKKKGDEPDLERAGKILMDEYRGGKLGRLTLELPEDIDVMLEQKKARAAEKAVLDKERKKAYNNKKKK